MHGDIAFVELGNKLRAQTRCAEARDYDKQNRTCENGLGPREYFAKQRRITI